MKKLSVIIDTDIGSDIDDTWALSAMLADDSFDIRLVTTVWEDVQYKCALVKELAACAGKEFPVAAGVATPVQCSAQKAWLEGELPAFRTDFEDLFFRVAEGEEEITVAALGPMTNLARGLEKYPQLAPKLKIVAMIGAIRKGYINQSAPGAECNAALDPEAFRKVLQSGARVTIVPLDVCRDFIVDGESFRKIMGGSSPLAKAVAENYRIWHRDYVGGAIKYPAESSSGILYDMMVVFYLRFPELFRAETLPVAVTDDGRTVVSGEGTPARCLLEYEGREKLTGYLVNCLS